MLFFTLQLIRVLVDEDKFWLRTDKQADERKEVNEK